MAILTVVGFVACSSDDPDGGSKSSLKMNRLNLENAQYLTLGESRGSRANLTETLFKVDADGNTSVVMLECVDQEDGSTKNYIYNVEVMPEQFFGLTKSWMFLLDCKFYCADNEDIAWKLTNQYNEPAGSYSFNILANKKTGKVYYVPDAQALYFYPNNTVNISDYFAEDKAGNLYTTAEPTMGLSKVSVTPEGAVITKLGPAGQAFGGKPYIMPNGNIITIYLDERTRLPYSGDFEVVYPNGGFETYQSDYTGDSGYITCTNNVIYRVILPVNEESGKTELQLQTISVGNTYGSISVSEPILRHELNVPLLSWWYAPLYMGENYIIFGSELAYNKQNGTWIEHEEWPLGNGFITPTETNVYKNKTYIVWATGASWMDLNTLEIGAIEFDIPGYLSVDNFQSNIPGGECFTCVTDPTDGKSYVYRIDITNGSSTRSEIAYDSSSVTLIPLN